jgi:hypothetical protein
VGNQGPTILPGETGTFYLKANKDGSYDAFHWSAVKAETPGSGELPACPKNVTTPKTPLKL